MLISFFRFYLPFLALVIAGALYAYHGEQTREVDRVVAEERVRLDSATAALERELIEVARDVQALARLVSLQDALENPSAATRDRLAQDLLGFAANKTIYEQLRWLDETGREVVRIDFDGQQAHRVADSDLQHKGGRYYFSEAMALPQGALYASPLDLNVEHHRVERPDTPMIRIGAPLFNARGERRGILLLNYRAQRLLDQFTARTPPGLGAVALLNRPGYWLQGGTQEQAWAFMFGREESFGRSFPAAWRRIAAEQDGMTSDPNGLFVFRTIHPIPARVLNSTRDASYPWKAVSHITPQQIAGLGRHARDKIGFATLLLLLIGALGSALYALAWRRHERSHAQLQQAYAKLSQSHRDAQAKQVALSALELRITQLANSSLNGHYIYDFTVGAFTYINSRYSEITGYDLDALNIASDGNPLELIHPDERDGARAHLAEVRSLPPHTACELRFRLRHALGDWIWCHVRDAVLEYAADGRPSSMVGSLLEVTESMRSELALRASLARFQAIFDNSGLGILVIDWEGRVVEHNTRFATMLGYAPQSFACETIDSHTHPQDVTAQAALFAQARRGGEDVFSLRKRYICADGQILWCLFYISLIGLTGQERNAIGIVQDISNEVALEEEKQRQSQILIQQSKMAAMGEMIGAIAHQWRQPLTAVGMALFNIRDAYAFDELTEGYLEQQVESAQGQITQMSQTIDDFRNFFAPSKASQIFCVVKAAQHALAIVHPQLHNHDLNLALRVGHNGRIETLTEFAREQTLDISYTVQGYPNEFIHVVLNLVINAKDAIMERIERRQLEPGEGAITLTISASPIEVAVVATDNGGGLDDAIMARLFEPYFTNKVEGKGAGIGLYMSKMIIEQSMGGTLMAANHGPGAEFTIRLPRAE
ncbi:PAS domain S-box protein [Magnetofaba australis]|uniref:histidine kinase n=1 Tax=Magnetofaba australis IT-1 TaxID=1434232 RepID=A0A1Y2K9B4_9PROT|nr:PAS domain S-box protein [Magnetofaba australis]OSM07087.1 putative Sensor protein fixL [Magnetofaba australis IT-1]